MMDMQASGYAAFNLQRSAEEGTDARQHGFYRDRSKLASLPERCLSPHVGLF